MRKKRYLIYRGLIIYYSCLSFFCTIPAVYTVYSQDFHLNFDNPAKLPYLVKKIVTPPYSRWAVDGFDNQKKMFWIQFQKKPVCYMFYKLLALNPKNFYNLRVGYEVTLPLYLRIYIIFIDKNLRKRGHQLIFNDILDNKKKLLTIVFKPKKQIKKALLYFSIIYSNKPAKLYLKNIAIAKQTTIYSNLDYLSLIPYNENIKLKICFSGSKNVRGKIGYSFFNILNRITYLKDSIEMPSRGSCVNKTIKLISGIYSFDYYLKTATATFKRKKIIWVTSHIKKLRNIVYAYNTNYKLFIKTIPYISFFNYEQNISDSIILQPFLYDGIFYHFYAVNSFVFFKSNFARKLLHNIKIKNNLKNLFVILDESDYSYLNTIKSLAKSYKKLFDIFFIKKKDMDKDIFKPVAFAKRERFLFMKRLPSDIFERIQDSIWAINYEHFEKFIPWIFLKLLTYQAHLHKEDNFSEEYRFYLHMSNIITVVKYAKTPIELSLFPIEDIISNIEIDLKQFGYDTDKKIYILKFKGELPSSLRKTRESINIAPRTFYMPTRKILCYISFQNHFNQDLEIKHISIHTKKEWEISINPPSRTIKNMKKIRIPFVIELPPITPLKHFVFNLNLKLFHRKIGDFEINKMFTL
ncbi:MAG: hypothetical protein ACK4NF_05070, partial [Planctomycetota bacterium]